MVVRADAREPSIHTGTTGARVASQRGGTSRMRPKHSIGAGGEKRQRVADGAKSSCSAYDWLHEVVGC